MSACGTVRVRPCPMLLYPLHDYILLYLSPLSIICGLKDIMLFVLQGITLHNRGIIYRA